MTMHGHFLSQLKCVGSFAVSPIEPHLCRALAMLRVMIMTTLFSSKVNLFPREFARAFPFPSFNVRDLDTVDLGVNHHIGTRAPNNDTTMYSDLCACESTFGQDARDGCDSF